MSGRAVTGLAAVAGDTAVTGDGGCWTASRTATDSSSPVTSLTALTGVDKIVAPVGRGFGLAD